MKTFTKGELEIMKVLWDHGALKPGEIQERHPRDIRNAALRSALLVLMEKGHVTREREGKAFVYRAVSKPRKEFKKMTRRLADIFCAGSAKELIAQLIESERLTDDELKEIEAIATAKKKTTGKK